MKDTSWDVPTTVLAASACIEPVSNVGEYVEDLAPGSATYAFGHAMQLVTNGLPLAACMQHATLFPSMTATVLLNNYLGLPKRGRPLLRECITSERQQAGLSFRFRLNERFILCKEAQDISSSQRQRVPAGLCLCAG